MSRVYLGNLPADVRRRDLEELFGKYGRLMQVDIKVPPRRPAYAFIDFENPRDAEDAVRGRDRYPFCGDVLRVEVSHGKTFRYEKKGPSRRSDYRVVVTGLPPTGSWQDLKDHMRRAGDVCYTDVSRDGTGVVEFTRYEHMKYAVEKLNDSEFRSHKNESAFIRVREERGGKYYPSPRRRSYSPRRRSYSPKRRSPSPPRKSRVSPSRRVRTPSPRRRSPSPPSRKSRASASPPKKDDRSPGSPRKGRSKSPRPISREHSASPIRRSLSPLHNRDDRDERDNKNRDRDSRENRDSRDERTRDREDRASNGAHHDEDDRDRDHKKDHSPLPSRIESADQDRDSRYSPDRSPSHQPDLPDSPNHS